MGGPVVWLWHGAVVSLARAPAVTRPRSYWRNYRPQGTGFDAVDDAATAATNAVALHVEGTALGDTPVYTTNSGDPLVGAGTPSRVTAVDMYMHDVTALAEMGGHTVQATPGPLLTLTGTALGAPGDASLASLVPNAVPGDTERVTLSLVPDDLGVQPALLNVTIHACAEGHQISGFKCVECDPGLYGVGGTEPCTMCDAGKYAAGSGAPSCQTAPPGRYAMRGANTAAECSPGKYGAGGSETSSCDGVCDAGYFCAAGSTGPQQDTCGAPNVYCMSGFMSPSLVLSGFYGAGGTSVTRTHQLPCPAGSYCQDGVAQLCPAGVFGDAEQLATATCSGQCSAGYVCPAGSTSSTAVPCGSPALFCQAGSGAPVPVDANHYSTGGTETTRTYVQFCTRCSRAGDAGDASRGADNTRHPACWHASAQELCPAGSYCAGGVRTLCPAGRYGSTTASATPRARPSATPATGAVKGRLRRKPTLVVTKESTAQPGARRRLLSVRWCGCAVSHGIA